MAHRVNPGLVIDLERFGAEGEPEQVLGLPSLDHAGSHRLLEELEGVPAVRLCPVHGDVGTVQERFDVFSIVGEGGDADAGGDVEPVAQALERLGECVDQPPGEHRSIVEAAEVIEDDGELVATPPADGVALADAGEQPLGHECQQDVAHLVAEAVVDRLEAV